MAGSEKWRGRWVACAAAVLGALGMACSKEAPASARAGVAAAIAEERVEAAWLACEAEIADVLEAPRVEPVRGRADERVELLGHARGADGIFVRAPRPTAEDGLDPLERQALARFVDGRPGGRVVSLQERLKGKPESLRRLLLREGYAYFDEPLDGHWFSRRLSLTDLFAEPRIVLQRGAEVFELERRGGKKLPHYVHTSGTRAGEREVVLFGDRVAIRREELAAPLHRDVVGFAREQRLDRIEPVHLTEDALVARLVREDQSVLGLLRADGAKLELTCLAAPEEARRAFEAGFAARADQAERRARVARAIDAFESERPEFDRPRGVEGPDRDGELRPYWMSAYLGGRQGYEVEEETYTVFLPDGRPNPPQVCVDLVLNVFERAAGTWFAARGDKPARVVGSLDFSALGMENRRGVLALGEFAEKNADLFEYHRFPDAQRVPFHDRASFFRFLLDVARLQPGDVVTIQGLKADDRVHQHAILVENVDPITGFPHALADKLGGSYRSTWEDVMAEAPKRSVLYRARPTDKLWAMIR